MNPILTFSLIALPFVVLHVILLVRVDKMKDVIKEVGDRQENDHKYTTNRVNDYGTLLYSLLSYLELEAKYNSTPKITIGKIKKK